MDRIHRLPFIISGLITIIIGSISFLGNNTLQETYIKMAVSMVIFYLIGVAVKNTIIEINEQVKKKKKEEQEALENEQTQVEAGVVQNQSELHDTPHQIDYRIED